MSVLSEIRSAGSGPQGRRVGTSPAGFAFSVANSMYANTPHFLLFSEAAVRSRTEAAVDRRCKGRNCRSVLRETCVARVGSRVDDTAQCEHGESARDRWRFVLQSVDDGRRFSVSEREPDTSGERLELLAVVRGLEALEQPSRVTLVTRSRYVSYGLAHGLEEWRESGWKWERFGRMVPVKNADLWQRIDGALRFHEVECRRRRFDPAAEVQSSERETQTTKEPLSWLTGSSDGPTESESDGARQSGKRLQTSAVGEGHPSTDRAERAASHEYGSQGTASRRTAGRSETAWGTFGRRLGSMGRRLHRRTSLAASP